MIHPDTELQYINDTIGYGVFATALIPRGTIIWVRDELDRTFDVDQFLSLSPSLRDVVFKYSYIDPDGNFVMSWDHARFMNHSCVPNCRSPGWDFEIALRDILPGEELTDDYGALNLPYDMVCACGARSCRGVIRASDFDELVDQWDEEVSEPFRLITSVAQPLWPLLRHADDIHATAASTAPIPSCVALRYQRAG